ncbi:MAG: gamma-glutamylcyclotransferase [Kofleriaceae bacterium]|nr:gamma-glutamylcyclotransferase [Kofleriaceae bacterium]
MADRTPRRRREHTRVFVYGSLLRGLHNHRLLDGGSFIALDRTRPAFTLVDLGSFPAMSLGGVTAVAGEIWEVDAASLERLDALEGHPRWYQRTPIVLASRRRAETYLLPQGRASGKPTVPTGDWRDWLVRRR